jgi:hypothetical protein
VAKRKPDEAGAREIWIQERLGDRKYRQLRMHLNSALRLLGELAAEQDTAENATTDRPPSAPEPASDTTNAMTALTERLQALSPRQRAMPMRQLRSIKRSRKAAGKR